MAESQITLRPVKRYITTHDPRTGKSIYLEAPELVYGGIPGFGQVARLYATSSLPVRLGDEEDVRAFQRTDSITSYTRARDFAMPATDHNDITGPVAGVNINVLDLAPAAQGHWHKTLSFDISICVMGEIDHELDSGQIVRLLPG